MRTIALFYPMVLFLTAVWISAMVAKMAFESDDGDGRKYYVVIAVAAVVGLGEFLYYEGCRLGLDLFCN